jgi:hypothetical protein
MAEVLSPVTPNVAEAPSRRSDVWVAATALVAGMAALPLAQSTWHGPEVAATLAVAAVAMLAGQRWAIAIIVMAQLLLLPTIWPRAFLGHADLLSRMPALISVFAVVPGILSLKRAAAALVMVTGVPRTRFVHRGLQAALTIGGLVAVLLPLF